MLILKGVLLAGSGVIIYVPIGLSYYGSKGLILNRCYPGINTISKDGTIIIPATGRRF
jgi:hypothetical protein